MPGDQGGEGDFDGLHGKPEASRLCFPLTRATPTSELSDRVFLCQLLDQPIDFVERAACDKTRVIAIANEDT